MGERGCKASGWGEGIGLVDGGEGCEASGWGRGV